VTPTHTFTGAGSFSVELTVTDPQGASSSSSSSVTVSAANRPPVASAGGPYTGDAGQTITFSAAQSSDPDDDPLTYSWTFGDGSSAMGSVVRRSYSTPGSYAAQVTVADGRGGTATASAGVTVRAINQRPTAQIGGPYRGEAGQAIAFAGSGSDPDQDPLTFAWSFGDGTSASGAAVSHAFAGAGTFTVSLTVSDGRGGSSAASTQVLIAASNHAPSARISVPPTASAGSAVLFSADGSTDPDSDPLTYSWSFGDGRSATGASPFHAFESAGTFTVTLVATDTRGASSTATASITVNGSSQNRPPVAAAGGPYNGEVNLGIAFSGFGSTDPDGDALTAWDYGDGSTGSGVSASHAYAAVRDYTVTLTVSDTHGATNASTAVVHVAAQVDRTPPIVTLSGPHSVLPGTRARVQAQAVDNVGVASVAFEVAGAAAGTFSQRRSPSTSTSLLWARRVRRFPSGPWHATRRATRPRRRCR
jgi:PKD repeat protein